MKRYSANGFAFLLIGVMGLCAAAVIGCAATGTAAVTSPMQTAINTGVTSYTALDQAILATDAAVKAGVLKGQDAKNALAGFTVAKKGLDTGLAALRAANAASSP
jgi:hypothetical protein